MTRGAVLAMWTWAGPAYAQGHADVYVADGTAAFEDLPGAHSDGDQNDLVVRFNKRCRVAVPAGALVEEELHFAPVAAGADLTSSLVLRLPGVPSTVTIGVDQGPPLSVCAGDCTDEVTLFADFREGFVDSPAGFVNTDDAPIDPAHGYAVVARYAAPVPLGTVTCADPVFEVRRPGVTIDATSTLGNGQPLLGLFPGDFAVPTERTPIDAAYAPAYLAWLTDRVNGCVPGTCADEGWYTTPVDGLVVVRTPDLDVTAPLYPQASCFDGVMNLDETDVDCGGLVCGACAPPPSDGTADWTAEPDAPFAHVSASSAVDVAHDRLLVHGGATYHAVRAGTLALDLGTGVWAELTPTTGDPDPVLGHAVILDAPRDRLLLLFGETTQALASDVFALDVSTPGAESWSALSPTGGPPDPRVGAAVVRDPASSDVWVAGGRGYHGLLPDTWVLTMAPDHWAEVDTTGEVPARAFAAAVFAAPHGTAWLIGGEGLHRTHADGLCLTVATGTWSPLVTTGATLPALSGASAAWHPTLQAAVVHGGATVHGLSSATWLLRATGPCAADVTLLSPQGDVGPAVVGATLAYSPTDGAMWSTGGQTWHRLLADAHTFDP